MLGQTVERYRVNTTGGCNLSVDPPVKIALTPSLSETIFAMVVLPLPMSPVIVMRVIIECFSPVWRLHGRLG